MSLIDDQKKFIRKRIRDIKLEIPYEIIRLRSAQLFQDLDQLAIFNESKTVMLYWSMDDEVFTHDFILKWQHTKQIILPSVDGSELRLKEFKGLTNMVPGSSFGILEPSGKDFAEFDKIELIIVPGIAFDCENNRMGRGKAYYDKLLKNSQAYKIGVCFDFQVLPQIPVDEYDIKMDRVLAC